ncbi:putative HTH-type transcriptional regulator [Thalassocella blandensis]|nr:putative HTH-type transcriptional regulator [Thalassocella blandensis]
MEKFNFEKLNCSLAIALATIGDPWSTLILRDFMIFGGTRRFEQLREGLGISRNVLTERLRTLLEQGILKKFPVEEGARRMEYKLTRKGWELMPMLLATHQWCEKWREDPGNSALKFVDALNGEEISAVGVYSKDGRLLQPNELRAEPRTEKAASYLDDLKTPEKKNPLPDEEI